ncbi:MAG: hypothetical protein ACREK2_04275 [Gemmatimonadota bacterium]
MRRTAKIALLVLVLAAATVIVWLAGGFLWPRPQFDRPGTPWAGDTVDPED